MSDEWNEELVQGLLDLQVKALAKNKQLKEKGEKPKCIDSIIVIDDGLGLPGLDWYSKLVLKILSCYRHYRLTVIITTQHPNKVPTILRLNCNIIITLRMNHISALKALFECMSSMDLDTQQKFNDFYRWVTGQPHMALIYLKDAGNSFKEQYKMFRAPAKVPDFHISV